MLTLARKVRFLADTAAYRERPDGVHTIETHMSWVFLAGDHAYKLKKPVKYSFLDFSTPEARRHHCEEEVRLNRRLADDTYIGVIPLRLDASGNLTLYGEGAVVDWLVKMKRLPSEAMLDGRIRTGNVSSEDVAAVGGRLAAFYRSASPEIGTGTVYIDHLMEEQAINRDVIGRTEFGLNGAIALVDGISQALERSRPEIEARIAGGHVVEGHGDLRPEHICLTRPPLIIDCLEFNRNMRIVDPYDEVNYLGLECELLGAAWIRPQLVAVVDRELRAHPGTALIGLLGAFRCVMRARISLAHLFDPEPRKPEHWPRLARAYLGIAKREFLSFSDREDG